MLVGLVKSTTLSGTLEMHYGRTRHGPSQAISRAAGLQLPHVSMAEKLLSLWVHIPRRSV